MEPKKLVECNGRTITIKLCDNLRKCMRVILLLADPGIGKTTYLSEYKKNNSGVYICTVGKSFRPADIFVTLLRGIKPKAAANVDSRIYFVMRELVETINSLAKPPLIIFDEAGKIKPAGYSLLQELFDETKGRASYVVSGPPYVDRNIQRAINNDTNGMHEFRRRINEVVVLPYPMPSELASLPPQFGVTDPEWIQERSTSCKTFDQLLKDIEVHLLEKEASHNGYKPLTLSHR